MKQNTGSHGMDSLRLMVTAGCVVGIGAGVLMGSGCGKGDRWWKKKSEQVQAEQEADSGSGSGPGQEIADAGEVDTSLSALSKDDSPIAVDTGAIDAEDFGSTREQVLASARMMEEYFSGMEAGVDPVEAVVVVPLEEQDESGVYSSSDGDGSFSLSTAMSERVDGGDALLIEDVDGGGDGDIGGGAATGLGASGVDEQLAVVSLPADPEERKGVVVDELVGLLTEIARTSENPGGAAAALAGMESVSVQTLEQLFNDGVLSESEFATLKATKEFVDSIVSSGSITSPEQTAEVLERIKRDLDRQSGIRVARALLCTRVDGFGKYEPFASNEFIAGRAQEVIVYVEVDRFGHRELAGNDGQTRYEVEMSQRLELYHVADDLNTWNRAAEVDRSVSRNIVRDYYLINKVTLPSNLGVGRYHLKVVMRDLVEEKIGEAIIPIRMVVR